MLDYTSDSGNGTTFMDKSAWLRAVVGLTSVLSMVGSLLIILSYVCFKDLRNKAREILVHISIMDLGVGASNLAGVGINFNRYYREDCNLTHHHHHGTHWHEHHSDTDDLCNVSKLIEGLCLVQGGFAVVFTLGSIFWTISLSMYLYLLISQKGNRQAKHFVKVAYLFCYLMPVALAVWMGATRRIGYSPFESSGWCGAIFIKADNTRDIFAATMAYNLWIFLTFVLVPLLSISAHMHIREEVKLTHSSRFVSALQAVDYKFLLVPVAFILLRIWSFAGDIWFVYTGHQRISIYVLAKILMYLEGIGDSGQGIANGIIFVLFTKKARKRFICCWRHCRWWRKGRVVAGNAITTETTGLLDSQRQRINYANYMDNTYTPSLSPRVSPMQ